MDLAAEPQFAPGKEVMAATSRAEDPLRIGMEEPPGENRGRSNQQPEALVAAESPALELAPLRFSHLSSVRLDASFNHMFGNAEITTDSIGVFWHGLGSRVPTLIKLR